MSSQSFLRTSEHLTGPQDSIGYPATENLSKKLAIVHRLHEQVLLSVIKKKKKDISSSKNLFYLDRPDSSLKENLLALVQRAMKKLVIRLNKQV